MGPFGSGKSVGCCAEIIRRCSEQAKGPDGFRRSRWAVVRNSYRELEDTTVKTWHDWFPPEMGRWRESKMVQEINVGDVRAEILFRSLDKADDIKKLLSLELTGAWVNEARELWAFSIIKALRGRLGRYPSMRDGVGPSWYGLIMDTNPPDEDHWWYRTFEEDRPKGWQIFRQPGGRSAEAENLANLVPDYYEAMCQGADDAWISVYVDANYGFVQDGRPMYPEYQDSIHTSPTVLEYRPELTLYLGLDFGLTPAAVFAQQQEDGQWQCIDELVTDDMGAERFAGEITLRIKQSYPQAAQSNKRLIVTGDPSGSNRAQTDEKKIFEVLEAAGLRANPAWTNDPLVRHDALAGPMKRLTMAGRPGILVSPKCKMFRKGLAGGYKMRRLQVVGSERYADSPEKNIYSHVCEAGEYLMMGAGEGDRVVGGGIHRPSGRHRPRAIGGLRARR